MTQWATPSSGSTSGATNARLEAREDEPVDRSLECTFRCTTTRSRCGASARQAAWLPLEPPLTRNQLRFAPHASAASRWASWNGAFGSGPTSIPGISAGMSSWSARSPSAVEQRRVRPRPALVSGHVKAARVAIGVFDQGVEVGRRVLLHPGHVNATSSTECRPAPGTSRRPALAGPNGPRLLLPSARPRWTTTDLEVPGPGRRRALSARPASDEQRPPALLRLPARRGQRTLRRGRVRARRARGAPGSSSSPTRATRGATVALNQIDHIDEYLSACQVGITLASIGIGFLGEPAIADLIEPVVEGLVGDAVAYAISFAIAYAWSRSLHIILGEQVPKSSRSPAPRRRRCWIARPFTRSVSPAPFTLGRSPSSRTRIVRRSSASSRRASSRRGTSPEELQGC